MEGVFVNFLTPMHNVFHIATTRDSKQEVTFFNARQTTYFYKRLAKFKTLIMKAWNVKPIHRIMIDKKNERFVNAKSWRWTGHHEKDT